MGIAKDPSLSRTHIKLPKTEVKKFLGYLLEWTEFWDHYDAAVHS